MNNIDFFIYLGFFFLIIAFILHLISVYITSRIKAHAYSKSFEKTFLKLYNEIVSDYLEKENSEDN